MESRISLMREKSQKTRKLLAQQLGITNPDHIGKILNSKQDQAELRDTFKKPNSNLNLPVKRKSSLDDDKIDTSHNKEKVNEDQEDHIGEEEIYTDSSAFLKGTQSANPHNDYCQNFVDTGKRPQNFIHDVGLANRFEEYPKLRELIKLKDELITQTNTPPMYLKADLNTFDFHDLDSKFDVILIEPPLEEYQRTMGVIRDEYWSWEMIENLEIEKIAAQRCFLWIWCGSSDGLDAARRCLKKWGFRRCEDICWIKTNLRNPGHNKNLEPKSICQRTKEHCLMGIKGTVRRSTDGDFIHANVDIDLIIDEEAGYASDEKPAEMFNMIEHFCLGRRRLHIFGRDSSIRPGWLSIGPALTSSNFETDTWAANFKDPSSLLSGCTDEIERLRPKSPPAKNKGGAGGSRGGARGGNAGNSNRGSPGGRPGVMTGREGGSGSFRGGTAWSNRANTGVSRNQHPGPNRGSRGTNPNSRPVR